MSAETVTNKIEEKARAAAEAIITEAKEKAQQESEATLANAKERAEKMLEASKLNAEIAEKGRAQTDALNTKLGLLGVKREMLDLARAEAKAILAKANVMAFTEIFSKYLVSSELSGDYILIPSAAHRNYCETALKDFEKAANISLTISDKNADIDTGFILSAENYDVEFSLDAILDEVFEQSEKEIADILFDTGDVK